MTTSSPPFFHVVAEFESRKGRVLVFSDLSDREVRTLFVRPYARGAKLLVNGEVVDLARIREVKVVRTEHSKSDELKILQERSRQDIDRINSDPNSGAIFISVGSGWEDDEIADVGADVTSEFLSEAPGSGGWWKPIAEHPWVVGIGTAVIAGLILLFFGAGGG